MLVRRGPYLERTQWRMTDVGAAHNLTVVFRAERDVAAVMQSIKAIARGNKFFDRRPLLLGDPVYRRWIGECFRGFEISLIGRVGIGPEVALWPDHAVAQDQQQLIVLKQNGGDLIVLDGVVDSNTEFLKDLIQAHADV